MTPNMRGGLKPFLLYLVYFINQVSDTSDTGATQKEFDFVNGMLSIPGSIKLKVISLKGIDYYSTSLLKFRF